MGLRNRLGLFIILLAAVALAGCANQSSPGGDGGGTGGDGALSATNTPASQLVIYYDDLGSSWIQASDESRAVNATGFEDGHNSTVAYDRAGQSQRIVTSALRFDTMQNASAYYSDAKSQVQENHSTEPINAGEKAFRWGDDYGGAGHSLEGYVLKGNVVWYIESDAGQDPQYYPEDVGRIAAGKY